MFFHYCTYYDEIEVSHSAWNDYVIIHFEQPDAKFGFKTMDCKVPNYQISNVVGFTDEEIARLIQFSKNNIALIIAGAKAGGIEKAVWY